MLCTTVRTLTGGQGGVGLAVGLAAPPKTGVFVAVGGTGVFVGTTVGACVGTNVGVLVGTGTDVGVLVATLVGVAVGWLVAVAVGGANVGVEVGTLVGVSVAVGVEVGGAAQLSTQNTLVFGFLVSEERTL